MSTVDLCDPVEAYVRPIRSVLFIDDQFPTFGQSELNASSSEAERARALWQACTARGWLCDVDNSPSWTSDERQRRLASCDLLVLDYHLIGDDSRPTLSIIRDLARSATPNLVVVYTKDPELNNVLLAAASWARGVGEASVREDLEDLEESIEWSLPERVSFLSNTGDAWKEPLKAACEQAGIDMPESASCTTLLERRLRRDYGVEPSPEIRKIEWIGCSDHRWFQCGNLFLVVVGKPKDLVPEAEAEVFLRSLEDAVCSWNPHWLACLMAHSRRQLEAGAFRDDVLVPEDALQNGLLSYIGDPTSDPPERDRRATEIATHFLSRRSAEAAKALGGQLLARADTDKREPPAQLNLLHLNAFLCSERFRHHHLHVGTIFALRTAEVRYWVCVTPACDMVPRRPDEMTNPWAFELDTFRPMVALRLRPLSQGSDKWKKAVKEAHLGRNLFFWDHAVDREQPLVAACFKDTADPNPWLEQMLAVDRARIREDRSIQLYRLVRRHDRSDVLRYHVPP